jgi:septal ring factor EnvC (AmiA/AmiB activator)
VQAGELGKLKKRYEMSEAQNAKLGDMVKVVKDQCEQEKGQMQKMLFDPQIADEQQRAYISDLEHQLGESQQALAEQKRLYDLQIRLLKSRLVKHSDS